MTNELIWSACDQDWWNRLFKVYEHLNVIGYQIDQMRQADKCPSKDLMELQGAAMNEFYSLLIKAGADADGPYVRDIL